MNNRDTQDFMLGQGGVRTGSIMNEVGLSTRGQVSPTIASPRPTGSASPGVQKLVGACLVFLGLWFASPNPGSALGYIPYAFAGLGAYSLLVGSVRGWKYPRSRFRLLRWIPPWVFLLATVSTMAVWIGTPHLKLMQNDGRCSYLGLNGYVTVAGFGRTCDTVLILPLDPREVLDHLASLANSLGTGR